MWTLIGYVAAVITIIALPGVTLYNCYRITDREITTNPYNITGSVLTQQSTNLNEKKELNRSYQLAVFDPHTLANNRKIQRQSTNLRTIEDARQKMVDIFVRRISPRHYIQSYTEQYTSGEDFRNDETLTYIKTLMHKNKNYKCSICQQQIKFSQIVEPILSYDFDVISSKSERIHVNHASCAMKQRDKK